MPIPDYQTLMRPTLQAFCDGAENVSSVLPILAEKFNLTQGEIEERIPSGSETLVADVLDAVLSGDGGIDGIVNEDELGLDAVYVQAKRYAPENKVGRPALNGFIGSLTGEGANKGVFVTTSDFSREAVDYISKVQHRIVLINGNRLARLMIKHEVGVRARRTLVVRSVDEDYFVTT